MVSRVDVCEAVIRVCGVDPYKVALKDRVVYGGGGFGEVGGVGGEGAGGGWGWRGCVCR